jgi:pyruvate/2-oxoglutarate dehydrogenase complex dihydrolipoamide acyltransferase (E2) component
MAYEFKLPDLGEGLTEGEIARWLVSEGQEIAEDDPLVEIQTDKTTVEIPSPAAGVVTRILAAEGDVVPVGTVIVVIGDGAATAAESPVRDSGPVEGVRGRPRERPVRDSGPVEGVRGNREVPPTRGAKLRATPLVRRLAQELGVDLDALTPTGPQGRVTEQDVRAAAPASVGEGRRVPLRGVRRVIAEHLARAQSIPAVTFVEECDFSRVDLALLVPTVLRAAALSLKEYPELNARLEGDEIVYLERYDLGIAVQTDQGLVVPVVRGCDTATVEELATEVQRLAEAARAGNLAPEELRGSTFSVTSAGKLGGLVVTPLINYPEVAILGVHRIGPRAVVREGEVAVRPVGNVSVTFDHRVVDGARAAEFALSVIRRLEGPGESGPPSAVS